LFVFDDMYLLYLSTWLRDQLSTIPARCGIVAKARTLPYTHNERHEYRVDFILSHDTSEKTTPPM
jgi:hypothetical protein